MAEKAIISAGHTSGALALSALAVLVAALLETLGWHPGSMLVIGAVAGAVVMLAAIILFYRQAQRSRVADSARLEEEARGAAIGAHFGRG